LSTVQLNTSGQALYRAFRGSDRAIQAPTPQARQCCQDIVAELHVRHQTQAREILTRLSHSPESPHS
jgi:hypothetical protein